MGLVQRCEVRFWGHLCVLLDGEPIKFRTRQQILLVAWLAVHAPAATSRSEIAALLWPEAAPANALAYLRRAIMELREMGIEVAGSRYEISMGEDAVKCDLFGGERGALLNGIEGPCADRIRTVATRLRAELVRPTRPATSEPATGIEASIVDALLRERPDVAMDLIALIGSDLGVKRPPGEVLALCQRVLDASAEETHPRALVLLTAARSAMFLTRYGLADKLFVASERIARLHGDEHLAIRVLVIHCFMLMEMRRWADALEMGWRAVESAKLLGDLELVSHAHVSLAGILWHQLEFDLAADHYRIVEKTSPIERPRAFARTNLAYLWAVFDIPFEVPDKVPLEAEDVIGYDGGLQAFKLFSLNLGLKRFSAAAKWAATHLDLTAVEGQERYLCVSFDCAAIVFGKMGLAADAAAATRYGSRLRWSLGHRRSPAESLAIRRHVVGSFFDPQTTRVLKPLNSREPAMAAGQIASRLRIAALSE
jgi:hypothetical protein